MPVCQPSASVGFLRRAASFGRAKRRPSELPDITSEPASPAKPLPTKFSHQDLVLYPDARPGYRFGEAVMSERFSGWLLKRHHARGLTKWSWRFFVADDQRGQLTYRKRHLSALVAQVRR